MHVDYFSIKLGRGEVIRNKWLKTLLSHPQEKSNQTLRRNCIPLFQIERETGAWEFKPVLLWVDSDGTLKWNQVLKGVANKMFISFTGQFISLEGKNMFSKIRNVLLRRFWHARLQVLPYMTLE